MRDGEKIEVGAVLFRLRTTQEYQPIMGDDRVALLRQLYQGHYLGVYEAFAYGHGTIDRTRVNWETTDEEVTG